MDFGAHMKNCFGFSRAAAFRAPLLKPRKAGHIHICRRPITLLIAGIKFHPLGWTRTRRDKVPQHDPGGCQFTRLVLTEQAVVEEQIG